MPTLAVGHGGRVTGAPGQVLVISDYVAARAWFATFLASKGCRCVVTSSGSALLRIRRGDCNAVLIDLPCSERPAEELVSEIEHAAPSLWGRVLVVTDEPAAREAAELTRGHLLVRMSRTRLIEELWPTLQPLLAAPPRPGVAAQRAPMAQRVFDSFRQPSSGVRGHHASSRQLVYRHEQTTVDVLLKPSLVSERIVLLGQILRAGEPPGTLADLSVALFAPAGSLVATRTNQLAEFSLAFEYIESGELELRFGEMLLVPLGDMDWAKRRLQ